MYFIPRYPIVLLKVFMFWKTDWDLYIFILRFYSYLQSAI